MQTYTYSPTGPVCSRRISFSIEDGKLHNVRFMGGCPGNLLAIGKLVEGADAKNIAELLKGNDCGGRGTSCADQLSRAVEAAMEKEAQQA
jgi:uncharacterized protein (TIGR03905 family)